MHNIMLDNKHFGDLNPLLCGWEKCDPSHRFGPYIRKHYLLHYVKSGRGRFMCKGKEYAVGANQMFLICPGEITTYIADAKDPWTYIWIGFDGKLALAFDSLPPVTDIKTNLFDEMTECERRENMREEFLLSKLYMLCSVLFSKNESGEDYVHKAKSYIDANYIDAVSICDIARMIGIDRTYLSKIFKLKMGMSMQQYLIHVRLNHAFELLENGYSIAAASEMCGYNDCFNFSKMFKKHFGISPSSVKGSSKIQKKRKI